MSYQGIRGWFVEVALSRCDAYCNGEPYLTARRPLLPLQTAVADPNSNPFPRAVISSPDAITAATAAQVVCDILLLDLGPLDLDLLGLTIHLDRVVLDIHAIPGAGNLVGNLLCAIVSLLDGPGILILIVQILNEIISVIGTLLPV